MTREVSAAPPRVRFGQIAEFRNGLNFDSAGTGQQVKVAGVGSFLQRSRLDDFSDAAIVTVRGEVPEESLLKDGDLLFVRSNGSKDLVGRCAVVFPGSERVAFSGFTIRARITSDDVDGSYLLAVARSELFRRELHEKGAGSSITNLSQELLREVEVPLPDLPVQRRIASALRAWDDAIDLTERLVAAKRRRVREALRLLVFGNRPAEDGGLSLAESRVAGTGRWPMGRIGDFASEKSRLNRAQRPLPVLSCTKHAGLVLSREYFGGRRVHSEDTSGYKIVERGNFAYATNHLEEGSIGLQDIVECGLVSPMYTVFEVDPVRVDRHFLISVLKTETYRRVFEMSTSSSVDRRGGLRWADFAALPFALPPIEQQRRISAILSVIQNDLSASISSLDWLRLQKRGLMQKLLMGTDPLTQTSEFRSE
ncbi:restriction endonuclease subunit S [Caulobacter sp. NIBR2454]|uniref:restriction endonuclease subunit S n=1 Tax=Caulobacter sp. NIBR2454 TaxID=3015996 RepID=UPI0022B646F7|nr:restriction endonuclease subunit S [Caulobacter sp. NIBR2454]